MLCWNVWILAIFSFCFADLQYSALALKKAVSQLTDCLQHRVLLRSKLVLIMKIIIISIVIINVVIMIFNPGGLAGLLNLACKEVQRGCMSPISCSRMSSLLWHRLLICTHTHTIWPNLSHKLNHELVIETSHQGAVPLNNVSQLCDHNGYHKY